MRRRFAMRERFALLWAAGGRCAECGDKLEAWHADHIFPWARGGATDVANGRACCPRCNQRKGARLMMEKKPLRIWQEEAIRLYFTHDRPDFLLEATPGAGKTRWMAEVALRLLEAGLIDRIIVVVPTKALRKQTAKAFNTATGLQLDPTWESRNGEFPARPYVGMVVTYAAVDFFPDMYRKLSTQRPTIVFLDEIHHAGDESSWGQSLRQAFELAARRVLLSGTPFRSDKDAIPFVRYVDGVGKTDKSISYGEALSQGIVRSVYFPRCGGTMEWINDYGKQTHTFDDDIDQSGASQRLRTALSPNGGHLAGMLKQAHDDLTEKRIEDPDAGGVVIAIDQAHAQAITVMMERQLGVRPVVVTSDEPGEGGDATKTIETFTANSAPWIVAVKMITEGVDIPRLRVGVYATNIVSEMFFRQFVGRVVRVQEDHDDHSAALFIPDDQRLRTYAQDIMEQREAVFKQPGHGPGDKPPAAGLFMPMGSSMNLEGMIVAGEQEITPEELEYANQRRLMHRETASIPVVKVALILRGEGLGPHTTRQKEEPAEPPLYEQLKKARTNNNRLVGSIHYKTGLDYKEINYKLNRALGIRTVETCSDLKALNRREEIATQWLRDGELREAAHAK